MSYIATLDYFSDHYDHPDATDEIKADARVMLDKVNGLLEEAEAHDVELKINPLTKTYIGGQYHGWGGFRTSECTQGAGHSNHRIGRAVDVYDPLNELDNYVTDAILEAHGLYREAPGSTVHWCHLTDKAPGSGHRTFQP